MCFSVHEHWKNSDFSTTSLQAEHTFFNLLLLGIFQMLLDCSFWQLSPLTILTETARSYNLVTSRGPNISDLYCNITFQLNANYICFLLLFSKENGRGGENSCKGMGHLNEFPFLYRIKTGRSHWGHFYFLFKSLHQKPLTKKLPKANK